MAVISSLGLAPLDAESRLAFAITSSTAFALVAWEFHLRSRNYPSITLLPYEIRLYRKSVWATAPPYAFLVLRYSSILATLPTIFLSAISTQNISCQTAASLSQAGMILVVISTAIIFTFRTAQLWAHNRKRSVLLASLGGLVLVVVGCCIAPAIQYRATSSTKSSAAFAPSNCHILPTPPYLPLAPAASLVFLLSALILSLLQLRTHDRNEVSKFTYRLYRAHVLYLFGATLTCTAALVILSLAPPASGLALCVPPLFVVLTCAFGTRAFRNYMLARVLEEGESGRGSPAAPYPSVSPIISHASEARLKLNTLHSHPRRVEFKYARGKTRTRDPPTSGSTAPLINVAGNTKLSPNPYTTFPSPPPSHDVHFADAGYYDVLFAESIRLERRRELAIKLSAVVFTIAPREGPAAAAAYA
ncbi:hypothetical protein C8F01DRAFT_1081623 [Mycena amicta]|nr:hypothetical protein C8F01DRAFT_1081623 [Mycena amicta]